MPAYEEFMDQRVLVMNQYFLIESQIIGYLRDQNFEERTKGTNFKTND